jgi:acetyltransferase-like isoleucine patch superfamily enzyme
MVEIANRVKILKWRIINRLCYKGQFGSFGAGSIILNPDFLFGTADVHIGVGVQIRDHARIETVKSRAGKSYSPRIEIGDQTSIEQGFHITCAEKIVIGKKVAITEYVGIFDIWHEYSDISIPIVDQSLKTAPVSIGDSCLIGMGVVIQPGVSIGRNTVIGANSVVTKSIPQYCVAVGAPARVIRHYDLPSGKWLNGPPKVGNISADT